MKAQEKTITRFPSWIKCLRDLHGNPSTVSWTDTQVTIRLQKILRIKKKQRLHVLSMFLLIAACHLIYVRPLLLSRDV